MNSVHSAWSTAFLFYLKKISMGDGRNCSQNVKLHIELEKELSTNFRFATEFLILILLSRKIGKQFRVRKSRSATTFGIGFFVGSVMLDCNSKMRYIWKQLSLDDINLLVELKWKRSLHLDGFVVVLICRGNNYRRKIRNKTHADKSAKQNMQIAT